ncbi:hypothetical protein ZONE111905_07510 [Zobellia nedashkovskayae]
MEDSLFIFSFNRMKKFILNCIIGLIIVLALDFGIGRGLEYFYFKQSAGFQHRTTHSIEHTKEDILVFGSSRANHHYKPDVFERKLKNTFYNTGRDGNFIFYQTAVLRSVLKRYKPKLILYDFTGEFTYNQSDYDRLSSLLPYYKHHPEIRSIVNLRSSYEPVKNLSSIYPYNSTIGNIVFGNINIKGLQTKANKGYVPLFGEWKEPIENHHSVLPYEIDKNKVTVFNEFLNLCKQHEIPVVVLVSPIYYKYEDDFSIALCKKLCEEKKVPFFDFTKDKDFLKAPHLFADIEHLNDNGAVIFSEKVVDLIKAHLKIE